jgi:uncharacterized protein with HEPN domain
MQPDVRDAALLLDMLIHARRAMAYTTGLKFEDYLANAMLRDAVERVILITGEAAAKVSAPFREAHPEIPWRPIIAQRHILVHEYGDVHHDKLWRVATIHIPALILLIEPLIPSPPPDPAPEPSDPR